MLYHHPDSQHSANKRRGFTLVELLVVIAIIAILSSIVFGLTRGIAVKQANTKAQAELQAIATALESYKLRYGDYPWLGSDTDSKDLFQHLTGRKKMMPTSTPGSPDVNVTVAEADRRPFLDEDDFTISDNKFVDPWGGNYVYYYRSGSTGWNYPGGFILVCKGADGKHDTTGLSNGSLPNDYFDDEDNIDNFVYGLEF